MNPRLARALCRVRGHRVDIEVPVAMTVHPCRTCGRLLVLRRGWVPRLLFP